MITIIKGLLKTAGGLIPGLGPTAYLAIALLATHGLTYGYGYFRGNEGKAAALVARDLEWQILLEQERNSHADALSTARKAAEAELPTPADRAERMRLCKQSPTCRERGS